LFLSQNFYKYMMPRFKKDQKVEGFFVSKEQFLADHNKLSSPEWRATMKELLRFETEKPNLFKNGHWSIEKIRRPFIEWLSCSKLHV
jgi:hypothetical protein